MPTTREIERIQEAQRLRAEVKRLRDGIAAHRNTTQAEQGDGGPIDFSLWSLIDDTA